MDPNVNVKVEAITESEITGVELGWAPNVQGGMGGYNSTSGASGNQGDMPGDPSEQEYSKCHFILSIFDYFPFLCSWGSMAGPSYFPSLNGFCIRALLTYKTIYSTVGIWSHAVDETLRKFI